MEEHFWGKTYMLDEEMREIRPLLSAAVDYQRAIMEDMVDESMEKWLMDIETKLRYEKWYAGHFHCDRKTDKLQIMYRNVELFCDDRDLKFSME